MLIGRVGRGGSLEFNLGSDKRRTNGCNVILNPSHCKILATLLPKGVKFNKVGWQLAMHNFKAKISPKWALLTANFWGGFGFSLYAESTDA